MKFSFFSLLLAISLITITSSCEKKDPEIPNEEEVITTLRYVLTPASGGADVVLSFQDLDGDGGDEPSITTDTLAANTIYAGALELLNEQESPVESIDEEVLEEGTDHQLFFEADIADLIIDYNDTDADGQPIGLMTTVETGEGGNGTLTITLIHEPQKMADGVANGDIQNAAGEIDIEVSFNVVVQ